MPWYRLIWDGDLELKWLVMPDGSPLKLLLIFDDYLESLNISDVFFDPKLDSCDVKDDSCVP